MESFPGQGDTVPIRREIRTIILSVRVSVVDSVGVSIIERVVESVGDSVGDSVGSVVHSVIVSSCVERFVVAGRRFVSLGGLFLVLVHPRVEKPFANLQNNIVH